MQLKSHLNLTQWIAGIGVTMLLIQFGFLVGWSSPTLARLRGPDSPIPVSPEQISWIVSMVNFGRIFGSVIGAVAASYLGSKRTIFITSFPSALGWAIIIFANSVEWLYLARLTSGVAAGMVFSAFPLYIGEVSMPEIRGALVTLATCGAPGGQVIASVCSSALSMSHAASVYFAFCVFLLGLFFWLPESPHYLVKIGRLAEAKDSIRWYRCDKGVEEEFEEVQNFVSSGAKEKFSDKLKLFKTSYIRRAMYLVMTLLSLAQICGLNSVIFYMEIILKEARFSLIDPSRLVMCVNCASVLAAVSAIFLIDRCGRRFLLLVSGAGTAIFMFGLTIHFILIDSNVDPANLQWLPLLSLFLLIFFFCIGLNPVPSTILSEIFPANIKCTASCIAGLTLSIAAFLNSKTYQPLVDVMGEAYVFMTYGVISLIIIPYTIFFVPETKGKSLNEIQSILMKNTLV